MGADATCLSNGDLSTLQYLCRPILQELNLLPFLSRRSDSLWVSAFTLYVALVGKDACGQFIVGNDTI